MPDLFISTPPETVEKKQIEPDTSSGDDLEKPEVMQKKEVLAKERKEKGEISTIELLKNGKTGHDYPGHSHHPMASYCYFPDNVDFVNRDPEEKVVLVLRKHPITNLGWMTMTFIFSILPFFLSALPVFTNLPGNFQIVVFLVWYMMTFAFAFEKFLSWFFGVNIITDERIFDVDFYSLIYRKMTDANIDQVQDVTVNIGGGIRTMLNFGDVIIQTAAEMPEIEFEAVPYPDRVARVLRELRVEEEIEKLEGRVR